MDDNFLSNFMNVQNFPYDDTKECNKNLVSISSPEILQNLNYDDDSEDIQKRLERHKSNLELRLQSLQVTVSMLRQQLAEEKSLWKKELEESMQLAVTNDCNTGIQEVVDELNDHMKDNELYDDTNGYYSELNNAEYEEKVSKYEQALLRAQAERRANLKRQISVNNYKRRLLEVENMCNLELLRVKQSAQYLQPLQMMASEWNTKVSSDTLTEEEQISNFTSSEDSIIRKDYSNCKKVEELLPIDNFGNRFCNEMNEVFARMQYCTLKSTASSNIWQSNDDDAVSIAPTKSSVWCQQEQDCPIQSTDS